MPGPKIISRHGTNVVTAAAHRQNKTGGRSVELSPRRRRFWSSSMYDYDAGANSPYGCGTVCNQSSISFVGGL